MTTDELQLIHEVAQSEPTGFVVDASYLPVAEGLCERDILARVMIGGEAVYFASASFKRKAVALAQYQIDTAEQATLN